MKISVYLFILHSLVQPLLSAPVEISQVGTQPQVAISRNSGKEWGESTLVYRSPDGTSL